MSEKFKIYLPVITCGYCGKSMLIEKHGEDFTYECPVCPNKIKITIEGIKKEQEGEPEK